MRVSYECLSGFGDQVGPNVTALGRQVPRDKSSALINLVRMPESYDTLISIDA